MVAVLLIIPSEKRGSSTQEIAVATGFRSATLVLVIFVLVALCLSFTLRFFINEDTST